MTGLRPGERGASESLIQANTFPSKGKRLDFDVLWWMLNVLLARQASEPEIRAGLVK